MVCTKLSNVTQFLRCMEFPKAGCIIVVNGADMCGHDLLVRSATWLPGEGDGEESCKELLSDMLTVKPEFIHAQVAERFSCHFLFALEEAQCVVHNLIRSAYMTLLDTRCYWAFRTWFSKLQVHLLVWLVMEGTRKENDAEGKKINSAFLSEASNDCYLRFFVRYKLNWCTH